MTYSYTYDDNGNILTISDGTNTTSYVYDSQNQLLRENNQEQGYTYTWEYDNGGNILNKKQYSYTTGTLGTASWTENYVYDDFWGDVLSGYNIVQYPQYSREYTVDGIGNLTYDGSRTYTWEHGRQLASVTIGANTWQYKYNNDGLLIEQRNGNNVYTYVYNGTQLSQMRYDGAYEEYTMHFTYDANGTPMTVTFDYACFMDECTYDETTGTFLDDTEICYTISDTYYYITNIQGDVIELLKSNGEFSGYYQYDAWGNNIDWDGGTEVICYNPLRYRGYFQDPVSGYYYLQTRFYDPSVGRFINADSQLNTSLGILGLNQFSYCLNSPVNMVDYGGNKPGDLFDTMDEAARDFAEYINEKSISVDCEYGSFIYKKTVWETQTITYYNPNIFGNNFLSNLWNYIFRGGLTKTITKRVKVTKYSYVEPKKGTAHSVSIPINWFGARNKVAEIHTHGAYSPGYSNDNFSSADLNNWINYLVTPLGTVRKYNPADGSDIIIYFDVPYDSNHPGRK